MRECIGGITGGRLGGRLGLHGLTYGLMGF